MKRRRLSPSGFIVLCFLAAALIGTALLMLPVSLNENATLTFVDALFTSAGAVCVTGLGAVDPASTFSGFGRVVLALLIQIGGVGVTTLGVGLMLLARRRVNLRERVLVREALNLGSIHGVTGLLRAVATVTLIIELAGTLAFVPVLARDYPLGEAIAHAAFHSISSFNNAGIDLFGGGLWAYSGDGLMLIATAALIVLGGLGFTVILDIWAKRSFKKLTLHSKVVLFTSGLLLALGTLTLRFTDELTWLNAFFMSASTRSAGYDLTSLSTYSNAGLLAIMLLMVVGASPGSTGGGIKTTTVFALIAAALSASTGHAPSAFRRKLPRELVYKSFLIATMAVAAMALTTFVLCLAEPEAAFLPLLFESVAAFSTTGMSMGLTGALSAVSKITLTCAMFIGRLGPLTIAGLWVFKPAPDVSFAEESIAIG